MERDVPERKLLHTKPLDMRVRRSRQGLRNALVDLLGEQPLADITVREIADRAEVGYTTFFRHFASKEALVDSIVAEEVERLSGSSLPIYDAADPLGACVALCRYVDERKVLWAALLLGGAAQKVRDAMYRQALAQISARAGDRSLPPVLGAALSVAGLIELLSWWLGAPVAAPPDEVGAILWARIVKPLASDS